MSVSTGKKISNNKKSVLKGHCFLSSYMSSFHDFILLNHESYEFKLLIKKSLLVTKNKPLSNKQVESLKLELF